jgi:hypothetical protein
MDTKKRNLLIVLGFIVLSVISGFAAYGFYQNNQSSNLNSVKPTSAQKVDPVTKQVIDDGSDQTKETYGQNPAKPVLIGFAALLDQGITQEDLTAFQGGISNYFVSAGNTYPPASVVVFSDASCGLPLTDGTVNCSYKLTVNDKTKLDGAFQTDENGHITIGLSKDGKTLYNTSIDENAN